MSSVDFYFDYACPYCYRAWQMLTKLMPLYSGIEIIWRPLEAHPRPEHYGPHSDLCIRGMFFAADRGADIEAYHNRVFDAIYNQQIDIEDADALCAFLDGVIPGDALYAALADGKYNNELKEANNLAYNKAGVWVVPALRAGQGKLDAIEDIGLSEDQILKFLDKAKNS